MIRHKRRIKKSDDDEQDQLNEATDESNEEDRENIAGEEKRDIRRKKKNRHAKSRNDQDKTKVFVTAGVAALFLIMYFVFGIDISSSKKKYHKRANTTVSKPTVNHITLEQASKKYGEGINFLKQKNYDEAYSILKDVSTKLANKLEDCKKGSKEYKDVERLLQDVTEAQYQAQKNIKLHK